MKNNNFPTFECVYILLAQFYCVPISSYKNISHDWWIMSRIANDKDDRLFLTYMDLIDSLI